MGLNYLKGFEIVLLSGFIDFLGDTCVTENRIESSKTSRTKLSVIKLKPLINASSLSRGISVVFSNLGGKISEDSV